MNSTFAESTLNEIERQIIEIESFQLDEKQNSYFAKYLVVFICGCYEAIIEEIIGEYVDRHHDEKLSKYVGKSLDLIFRNPDMDKIISLLEHFDKEWSLELNSLANANKKAVDSLLIHKNALAHTGNSTVTMSFIKDTYNRSKPVIQKIDSIVLK